MDESGWNCGRMDEPVKPEYNHVKDGDYIAGEAMLRPTGRGKQMGG